MRGGGWQALGGSGRSGRQVTAPELSGEKPGLEAATGACGCSAVVVWLKPPVNTG